MSFYRVKFVEIVSLSPKQAAEKKQNEPLLYSHDVDFFTVNKRGCQACSTARLLPSIQYQWHHQRRWSRTPQLASLLSHTEKSHLLPCLNFRTKTAGCQSLPQTESHPDSITIRRIRADPIKARCLHTNTHTNSAYFLLLANSEIAPWKKRRKKKRKKMRHVVRKHVRVFWACEEGTPANIGFITEFLPVSPCGQ